MKQFADLNLLGSQICTIMDIIQPHLITKYSFLRNLYRDQFTLLLLFASDEGQRDVKQSIVNELFNSSITLKNGEATDKMLNGAVGATFKSHSVHVLPLHMNGAIPGAQCHNILKSCSWQPYKTPVDQCQSQGLEPCVPAGRYLQ